MYIRLKKNFYLVLIQLIFRTMKQLLRFVFIFTATFSFSQTQIGSDINGESFLDQSGRSISISNDGNIVAIGAPNNDGNGSSSGHVRIYMNTNGNWVQIGQDIDGKASGDSSGASVSLSGDGNIVAVGGRVYKNTNGNWDQIGQDIDGPGKSVSLSSDGSIVAVGGRVYKNTNGNWDQVGQDIDGSGKSVSLSGDGSIVAIGTTENSSGGNGFHSGYTRIYKNTNGNWEQIGEDINGEAGFDNSGFSIGLSSDGSIIAIGAVGNSGNGSSSGHVRLFKNVNGNWEQIGQDIDGESAGDGSGYSLSISNDGGIVVIGAISSAENGSDSGQVRVYQNINENWEQIGQDLNGTVDDQLGKSVSISGDGSIIAVGAGAANTTNGLYSGYVKVYDLSAVLSSNSFSLSEFSIYPNPTKDFLSINSNQNPVNIAIYNVLGKKILSASTSNKIDVKSLPNGVYVIRIKDGLQEVRKKFIKN
jgi:hypothetical protein